MKNGRFIPEGLGESQHKKEKTRLHVETDKIYVKALQAVPTSEAPQAGLGLDEALKGWLQPCSHMKAKVLSRHLPTPVQRDIPAHSLCKRYAQGSTLNTSVLPLLHTCQLSILRAIDPAVRYCISGTATASPDLCPAQFLGQTLGL